MNAADPRRGKPSASGSGRLVNCPHSPAMEAKAPDTDSKDATSGDRVHAALAGTLPVAELEIQERQTFEMCEEQERRLFIEWAGDAVHMLDSKILRESRLGLTPLGKVVDVTPFSKAEFVFTGQYDVLYIQGQRGLLIDFKSLYGDIPDAVEHEQIAALAVLVSRRYGLTEVRGAIAQPRVGKPTLVDYHENGLDLAEEWLLNALKAAEESTEADRRAGAWCKFCKARFFCDKFTGATLQEIEVVNPMSIAGMDGKMQRAAMYSRITELTPARHFAAWNGLAMVERYVDAMKNATRDRAACDPEFQKFLRLEEGRQGNREIEDAQRAFECLAPLGVTKDDMIAASKVSVTKLQEAVRVRSGVKSVSSNGATKYNLTDKDAKTVMEKALDGVMTRKDPPLELVRVSTLEGGEK